MTSLQVHLEELNTRLETIEGQRNRALADHAIVAGQLSVEKKRHAETKEELAKLKSEVAGLNEQLAGLVKKGD